MENTCSRLHDRFIYVLPVLLMSNTSEMKLLIIIV